MQMRKTIFLLAVVLSLTAVAIAAVEMEKLVGSIDTLKSYKYGNTGGVDLRWVETQIGMASKDSSIRGQIEQKLIEALAAATTNDARQFLCRQLRTIGTEKAVPQLESMLANPEISHMARYALGRIEAPEAGVALHRALKKTSGKLKAGIINTLVKANYGRALGDFMKLIGNSDKDVAIAAIRATGHFPCNSSVGALRRARRSADKDIQVEIDAALLASAEIFLANGTKKRSAAIYEDFYSGKYPAHLRVAGLRGLAAARGEGAAGLLVDAIKGDDADLRRNAIGMMALIKGKKTTDIFVKLSKSLPADGQEQIVRSLAVRGDVSAVPAIIEMTGNEHENVRLAALEALGDIGTGQAIKYLAKAAATTGDREKRIARASLVRMKGESINDEFINAINSGDSESRVEVILAIGQRSTRDAFSALQKVAETEADASVRSEAILSMGRVGKGTDLETLVKLAVTPKDPGDRSSIEKAIVIVFNKTEDENAQAAPVISALQKAPDEAKPILLSLLTRCATSKALNAVRASVKSSDSKVSDAAIRALGQWPDAAPAEELYQIASSSSNQVHKVLALRSYIRMAALTQDPMAAYIKAMKLASRTDEIRLVLGGLHHAGSLEALEMAEKYMTNETLKAEAYMAGVKIANVYCWQDGARARITLDKIVAEAPNDNIRNQAGNVIRKMGKYKGLVAVFKGAGPYRLKGVNDGRRVFETPFAPEKDPDNESIRWQIVIPDFEGNNRINLHKTFGNLDYCCAYLRTIIHCPVEQDARLKVEADDYIKAWLNGKQVIQDIKLRRGANDFILKVGDHGGGWNFKCQILKPDGSKIEGLRFKPK
ncbi:MAG: HEAT repeat domain-containing protein [Planctomycetes bacterium]|nr:HEAT repeat domain-containing protein [Planctomycetota bacterium]